MRSSVAAHMSQRDSVLKDLYPSHVFFRFLSHTALGSDLAVCHGRFGYGHGCRWRGNAPD